MYNYCWFIWLLACFWTSNVHASSRRAVFLEYQVSAHLRTLPDSGERIGDTKLLLHFVANSHDVGQTFDITRVNGELVAAVREYPKIKTGETEALSKQLSPERPDMIRGYAYLQHSILPPKIMASFEDGVPGGASRAVGGYFVHALRQNPTLSANAVNFNSEASMMRRCIQAIFMIQQEASLAHLGQVGAIAEHFIAAAERYDRAFRRTELVGTIRRIFYMKTKIFTGVDLASRYLLPGVAIEPQDVRESVTQARVASRPGTDRRAFMGNTATYAASVPGGRTKPASLATLLYRKCRDWRAETLTKRAAADCDANALSSDKSERTSIGTWRTNGALQRTFRIISLAGTAAGAVIGAAFVILDILNGNWVGAALGLAGTAAITGLALGADLFGIELGPIGWLLDALITVFFFILPSIFGGPHPAPMNNVTEIIQLRMFGDMKHTGNEGCRAKTASNPNPDPTCVALYGPGTLASVFKWELFDAVAFLLACNHGYPVAIPDMAKCFTVFKYHLPKVATAFAAIACNNRNPGLTLHGYGGGDSSKPNCESPAFSIERSLINITLIDTNPTSNATITQDLLTNLTSSNSSSPFSINSTLEDLGFSNASSAGLTLPASSNATNNDTSSYLMSLLNNYNGSDTFSDGSDASLYAADNDTYNDALTNSYNYSASMTSAYNDTPVLNLNDLDPFANAPDPPATNITADKIYGRIISSHNPKGDCILFTDVGSGIDVDYINTTFIGQPAGIECNVTGTFNQDGSPLSKSVPLGSADAAQNGSMSSNDSTSDLGSLMSNVSSTSGDDVNAGAIIPVTPFIPTNSSTSICLLNGKKQNLCLLNNTYDASMQDWNFSLDDKTEMTIPPNSNATMTLDGKWYKTQSSPPFPIQSGVPAKAYPGGLSTTRNIALYLGWTAGGTRGSTTFSINNTGLDPPAICLFEKPKFKGGAKCFLAPGAGNLTAPYIGKTGVHSFTLHGGAVVELFALWYGDSTRQVLHESVSDLAGVPYGTKENFAGHLAAMAVYDPSDSA